MTNKNKVNRLERNRFEREPEMFVIDNQQRVKKLTLSNGFIYNLL